MSIRPSRPLLGKHDQCDRHDQKRDEHMMISDQGIIVRNVDLLGPNIVYMYILYNTIAFRNSYSEVGIPTSVRVAETALP
jgi:hypothetical protein